MAIRGKRSSSVRRSISIRSELDKKVQRIAEHQKSSTNRVIEDLVEAGLAAKEAERQRFFEIAERFRASSDAGEAKRMKQELARMIFGN